jgi:hypothetical protein
MEKMPTSLQLRYLQTLIELASERTSMVIFPVPVDTIEFFLERSKKSNSSHAEQGRAKTAGLQSERG